MKALLLCFVLLLTGSLLSAQNLITGTLTDSGNDPVFGASIQEKGTTNGAISTVDGAFTLRVGNPNATLVISCTGFKTIEIPLNGKTEFQIQLEDGITLGEVHVVGSRSYKRSSTDSPVAVDVIDLSEIPTRNGQVEINQILQYAAPSFNASKQSGSDGADHIDPASLRGLGPDQTLVLINGKRRHQSSLINVFGTRGRGNTGTDLNALPAAAIKRIEVLRDGASAQYGSDAIAGVINIVLKDEIGDLSGSITYGAYSTASPSELDGTANAGGKNRLYDDDKSFDGNTVRLAANYGLPLGENGGFANITTELLSKQRTLRPGADFRKGFGEAAIDGFNFMINAAVPLGERTEAYAFGGRNFRDTDAFAFTRNNPTARNVLSIYPDGFTPRITSNITDASISAGVKHQMGEGWNVDFNNTYGKNTFHYFIRNTLNASLEDASPTDFDAGGHSLSQNTTGLDFSKFYEGALAGINLAFGAEYRTENFQIFAGEEGSYATYDTNGLAIVRPDQVIPVDPETGEERPGGSQGFPGYSPANAVDRNRSNLALYADAEFNITKAFLIGAALRFEDYSDFGETFNYKLAARYNITKNLALRGSVSSGFRAPSLAQIYYNLRFTNFVGGVAQEVLLSPNNSPVTRGFGIDALKQETAVNTSLGLTFSAGGFSATIDAYSIDITDRIVLTEY
ncbi:MAG: TonB-dependent receptor, partial [Saprospiraceae bacterium]|nr:TonB-dependent receptor [Saprospiraceae bacterium]